MKADLNIVVDITRYDDLAQALRAMGKIKKARAQYKTAQDMKEMLVGPGDKEYPRKIAELS